MAFFTPIIKVFTPKVRPPSPNTLWDLPESSVEAICCQADKNNAIFIPEPPIRREEITNRIFYTTPINEGNIALLNENYGSTNDERVHRHSNSIQNVGEQNNSRNWREYQQRADESRQQEFHKHYSEDDDSCIPHHLLVQLGLAEYSSADHTKRANLKRKWDYYGNSSSELPANNVKNSLKIGDNLSEICDSSKHFSKASQIYAERFLNRQNVDSWLKNDDSQTSVCVEKFLAPRENQQDHSSLSQLFFNEEIHDKNTEDDSVAKTKQVRHKENDQCKTTISLVDNDENNDHTINKTDPDADGNQMSDLIRPVKTLNSSEGCQTRWKDQTQHFESQSSLSQLFQSQEFNIVDYRNIVSRCSASNPKSVGSRQEEKCESNEGATEFMNLTEEQPSEESNALGSKLNEDDDEDHGAEMQGLLVETRNAQPFVIRGCEPKMFDTSIDRKEDRPWKNEVRQGVLDPSKEISKRNDQEIEEIPLVVSPYFPNENNHPVQEGKRTSLLDSSEIADKVQSEISKDLFERIFEHEEATDEYQICRNFFKRHSQDCKVDDKSKVKKSKTCKTKLKDSRKITNYFPVIKNPKSKSKTERNERLVETGDSQGSRDGYERTLSKFEFNDLPTGMTNKMSDYRTPSYNKNEMRTSRETRDVKQDEQLLKQRENIAADEVNCLDSDNQKMSAHNEENSADFIYINTNEKREVTMLDEGKVDEIALEMELSGDLVGIGFTICYKDRYSILNRPADSQRKTHYPIGIMSRVEFNSNKILRIYQDISDLNKTNSGSFLQCLLESKCPKVCFESQAFIMLAMDVLNEQDTRACYEWRLLDPLIGLWLVDPDHPPHTFNCALKSLNIKVTNRPSQMNDWRDIVSYFLDAQNSALNALRRKLSRLNLWDVFYHMETPLSPMLAAMELRSIEVDYAQLKEISRVLEEKIISIEQEAWKAVGKKFQLSSPLQLRNILYGDLKLDEKGGVQIKSTASSGAKSTDEGTLRTLLGLHPLPGLIIEYRHAHKIKSTYIDGMLAHVIDKRSVTTRWEQCAAATGRITSSSPNLQSIPKREEDLIIRGERFNVRKIFVSRPQHVYVALDFQQIELRMFAHLSRDQALLTAFEQPGDIFSVMTKMRLGNDEFEADEREKTKTLMYALLYGAGAQKISELLSNDIETANKICAEFYALFPGLKNYRARVLSECRAGKELRSLSGRRRLFPNITAQSLQQIRHTERQAVNFTIQGSAADICKAAMLRTETALKERELKASLLLQIHDEMLWEVHEEDAPSAIEVIKKSMEATTDNWLDKFGLKVKLPVKITVGNNWGSMS